MPSDTPRHSLLTTGRTHNYDGPQISVSDKMYNGSQYNLSAWVMLVPTDNSDHIINLSLQTTLNGQTIGNFYLVNGTYAVQSSPYLHLRQGWNQISFNSLEGCNVRTPNPAAGGVQAPQICASVQFDWIAFVRSGTA